MKLKYLFLSVSSLGAFATMTLAQTGEAEKNVAAQAVGEAVDVYFVNASGGA